VPDDHDRVIRPGRFGRGQHVTDQGAAEQRVQNLGGCGLHPLPFPGSENDDGTRGLAHAGLQIRRRAFWRANHSGAQYHKICSAGRTRTLNTATKGRGVANYTTAESCSSTA
jgi:hypothetical protein